MNSNFGSNFSVSWLFSRQNVGHYNCLWKGIKKNQNKMWCKPVAFTIIVIFCMLNEVCMQNHLKPCTNTKAIRTTSLLLRSYLHPLKSLIIKWREKEPQAKQTNGRCNRTMEWERVWIAQCWMLDAHHHKYGLWFFSVFLW